MPDPDYGGYYATGTISVENGSTTVSGAGVNWSDFANGLDLLIAGGSVAVIDGVTGLDEITLKTAWAGATLEGAPYQLLKLSPLRLITPSALLGDQVRGVLQKLSAAGVIYTVAGDEPDAGVGNDGDFAIKTSTLPWTLWLKGDGDWVQQSQWVPFRPLGAWSSATTYIVGDLVQHGDGNFVSNGAGNLNHEPVIAPAPASDANWTLVPLPGVSDVLAALGITAVTISDQFPMGGVDGALWFKV
jgi:hypothetical protein